MSWKCAFEAGAPVAFRAVQFQLNFQTYVLSRLSPSLVMFCKNRKGSCSLQNRQFYVLHSQKLRSCSMFKLLHKFLFACWFWVWDSFGFYVWEISRSSNWPEKKLFYAILCWLILEATVIVQQGFKVPGYPFYFHRDLFLNMWAWNLIGCIFQEWFPTRLWWAIAVKRIIFKNQQILIGPNM